MTRRTHIHVPKLGHVLTRSGDDFVSLEALGGVALLAATVAALLWANLAAASYASLWSTDLTIGFGRLTISEDLQHWVNDGLMTVFFFVVGLEIKRELVRGELRNPRTAILPVLAAIGGMAVPALLFLTVNAGSGGSRGWAIPMATDIAFAVVILAILGSKIPKSLKLFLLTLAIVDDIGAIVVIALFYSDGIGIGWLAAACGVVAAMLVMQRAHVAHPMLYLLPAVVLWVCTLESGVHATLAGVVLGLLTPARPFGGRDVIEHLEGVLHPWSSLLVIPVFALANAGLNLELAAIGDAASSPIAWGIVAGLVVGKPLGIMAATGLGVLLRLGRLPRDLTPRQLFGMSCVAGIGFTVSLFVADLSFEGARLTEAKTGIFLASLLSAAAGVGWLMWASNNRTTRRSPSACHGRPRRRIRDG
jgi:NhaA family Na+:H+ antiporter